LTYLVRIVILGLGDLTRIQESVKLICGIVVMIRRREQATRRELDRRLHQAGVNSHVRCLSPDLLVLSPSPIVVSKQGVQDLVAEHSKNLLIREASNPLRIDIQVDFRLTLNHARRDRHGLSDLGVPFVPLTVAKRNEEKRMVPSATDREIVTAL